MLTAINLQNILLQTSMPPILPNHILKAISKCFLAPCEALSSTVEHSDLSHMLSHPLSYLYVYMFDFIGSSQGNRSTPTL
jgi:hypothetical protein